MKKKLLITSFAFTLLFSSICQFCHTNISPDPETSKAYLADETGDDKQNPPIPNDFNA